MKFIPPQSSTWIAFLLLVNGTLILSQDKAMGETISPHQSTPTETSKNHYINAIPSLKNSSSSPLSLSAKDLMEESSHQFVNASTYQFSPSQLSSESLEQNPTKLSSIIADNEGNKTSDSADHHPTTSPKSPWRFEIIPYLFVPFSLDGTVKFGSGGKIRFDGRAITDGELIGKRFSYHTDSFNLLPIALRAQAWNNNLGILFDGQYYGFSTSSRINFRGQERRKIYSNSNVSSLALGVGWKVATLPLNNVKNPPLAYSGKPYPSVSFQVLGGGRYGSFYQEIDLSPGTQVSMNRSWLAPMIGGEIDLQISRNFALGLWTDYSGFGMSGLGSTFNLKLGLDWNISPNFSIRPGYRFYNFDYKEDGKLGERGLNISANGLDLGLVFSF